MWWQLNQVTAYLETPEWHETSNDLMSFMMQWQLNQVSVYLETPEAFNNLMHLNLQNITKYLHNIGTLMITSFLQYLWFLSKRWQVFNLSISHFNWMLTENAKSTPRLDDRVKQSSYSKPVIWRWRHLQVIRPHHIPVASYMYPGSSPGTRLTFLHFLTRLYVLRGTCLFVCLFVFFKSQLQL